MDRNLSLVGSARRGFARGLALLPGRATALPPNSPSARPRNDELRLLAHARPFLWIGVSIALGLWAESASSHSALLGWIHEHHPSARLVSGVLRTEGFEEVKDPKLVQKLYRSLPATLGDPGEAWWAEEERSAAIAWIEDPESSQPFHVFCRTPCAGTLTKWQRLGSGWMALESALPRITALQARLGKPTPVAHRKSEYRDPRELRF